MEVEGTGNFVWDYPVHQTEAVWKTAIPGWIFWFRHTDLITPGGVLFFAG